MGEKKIMSSNSEEKDLLFYEAYEDFYDMAYKSKAFSDFCKEAYGEDFSQDGFSDISQVDMILEYIPKDAHILDVGCGNGAMLRYLQQKTGAYIHGFDYSKKAIKNACLLGNEKSDFQEGIIGEKEYDDNSFDLIICMDSIYFASDMTKFVNQIRRWLKPGGVLFVAYQEGDVMDKTENSDTTVFAKAMKKIGWEYDAKDITDKSYDMLTKKREVAIKYQDKLIAEGCASWAELLVMQTDYILDGREKYFSNMSRYIYTARKLD